MSIREEFEKSLKKDWGVYGPIDESSEMEIALWAAKWMAERCAKEVHSDAQHWAEDRIRQLARELKGGD